MVLVLDENLFPDVISIWHPLYKEKHMLAICGAVWKKLLGNQRSYSRLRNLHLCYLFEKMQKCWAWRSPSKLGERWLNTRLDLVHRLFWAEVQPSSPGAALAQGGSIWDRGGEATFCLGNLHRPSLQMIDEFPLQQLTAGDPLPPVFEIHVESRILGLGNRRSVSGLSWELYWTIWSWRASLISQRITYFPCNRVGGWTGSVSL